MADLLFILFGFSCFVKLGSQVGVCVPKFDSDLQPQYRLREYFNIFTNKSICKYFQLLSVLRMTALCCICTLFKCSNIHWNMFFIFVSFLLPVQANGFTSFETCLLHGLQPRIFLVRCFALRVSANILARGNSTKLTCLILFLLLSPPSH